MYDTIIIGAGPAGMSAAIYAARREMKALIITKEIGGQMIYAGEVENYPGFKSVPGFELIIKMQEHVAANNVKIINDEVKNIEKKEDGAFILHTNKESFETKTIIIAMGLAPRRMAIPGEAEFSGRGISYCANCDGPLFKNKIIAVIGGGNSALDAAELMSKISKQVYLINRSNSFQGFETLEDKVRSQSNVEIISDTDVKEIIGKGKLEKIILENSQTKEKKEIILDGLFIEIGRIAHTDLVAKLIDRDEKNQIITNEKCETSSPGIFAAGDITNNEFKQISIAVGQGTVSALSAYKYLRLKSGKTGAVLDRSVKKKVI